MVARSSSAIIAGLCLLAAACRHATPPAAGAVSTAGPSQPEPAVIEESSGTRLKVVWAVGPGGERVFSSWYDTKLDLECIFQLASDGKKRCLPSAAAWANDVFADGGCTVRAVRVHGYETRRYYRLQTPTCPPRVTVGRPGAELPADAIFQQRKLAMTARSGARSYQPTGCAAAVPSSATAFSLGETVPPETFVAATIRRDDRGAPLALTMLDGEDGSRDVSSWFDTRLGVECGFDQHAADGSDRCLPRTDAFVQAGFSDDGCGTPAATKITGPSSCEQVQYVRAEPANECPRRIHVLRGGPRLPSAYEDYGSAGCQPSTKEHYQMGPEVPPAELPSGASRTWRPGTGPLGVRLIEAGGKIVRRHFVDERFDVPCFVNTCGGDPRCLPAFDLEAALAQEDGEAYADPDCQRRLARGKSGVCLPKVVRLMRITPVPTQSVDCSASFYLIGPRHQGSVYRKEYWISRPLTPEDTSDLSRLPFKCLKGPPRDSEEFYRVERRLERSDFVKLHFERR